MSKYLRDNGAWASSANATTAKMAVNITANFSSLSVMLYSSKASEWRSLKKESID